MTGRPSEKRRRLVAEPESWKSSREGDGGKGYRGGGGGGGRGGHLPSYN